MGGQGERAWQEQQVNFLSFPYHISRLFLPARNQYSESEPCVGIESCSGATAEAEVVVKGAPIGEEEEKEAGEEDLGEYHMLPFSDIKVIHTVSGILFQFIELFLEEKVIRYILRGDRRERGGGDRREGGGDRSERGDRGDRGERGERKYDGERRGG